MKSKLPLLRAVLFSFLIVILLFLLFLPYLCDTYLLPRLISKLPFSHKELSLSRISPWKTRGTLRLLQDGVLVASIPKFELSYSPSSLLRGQFDTLLLDGCTVELNLKEGPFSKTQQTENSAKNNKSGALTTLPLSIQKIIVRDSRLKMGHNNTYNDFKLDSLVQFQTQRAGNHHRLTHIQATLDIAGEINTTVKAGVTFQPEEIRVETDFSAPNLAEVNKLLAAPSSLVTGGHLQGTGTFTINSQNLEIKGFAVNTEIKELACAFDTIALQETVKDSPILLEIKGDSAGFDFQLSNLSLAGYGTEIDLISEGEVNLTDRQFTTRAKLEVDAFNSQFALIGSGSFYPQSFAASYLLTADSLTPGSEMNGGPLELQAEVFYENNKTVVNASGSLGSFLAAPYEINAKNIGWDIQLQFPPSKTTSRVNRITIDELFYKNEQLAAGLVMELQQHDKRFDYSAIIPVHLGFKEVVGCQGTLDFHGVGETNCSLPGTMFDSSRLPGFVALPEATSFTGLLAANSELVFEGGRFSGNLTLSLQKGDLTIGETSISNIATTLHLPALPRTSSGPSQLATIKAIDVGEIHLDNGRIYYRIEEEPGVFLEKLRFSWCGGKIETGALLLAPPIDNLEVTLYCDRLGFAELLRQFGIEDTDGEGSLNGRLPVAFKQGRLLFDDGFLFSTPGNSGIVRFTDSDQLQQGIPNINQSGTLDYSIKALENFAYNWTKLTFDTEGDNLLMALQLDGKPAEPLPFGYKNGQIVAKEKGAGLQHPLRLDMNFRLPLQDLFQYGKSLQSMMENM